MALYDQIIKQAKVENTWEHWKAYRTAITEFLCHQAGHVSTCVILGAGSCADIALDQLLGCCDEIWLVDNDEEALETALEKYQKDGRLKKLVLGIDGCEAFWYRDFCENLVRYIRLIDLQQTEQKEKNFDQYALELLEGIALKAKAGQEEALSCLPNADVYICLGLCSQLQTMFAYTYHLLRDYYLQISHASLPNEGVLQVEAFLKSRNDQLIPALHDQMLKKAKQKIILGNEYVRRQKSDTITITKREAEDVLTNGQPIEGAYQAFMDIRKRNLSMQEYTVYWPFDEANGVIYEMLLQVVDV